MTETDTGLMWNWNVHELYVFS